MLHEYYIFLQKKEGRCSRTDLPYNHKKINDVPNHQPPKLS